MTAPRKTHHNPPSTLAETEPSTHDSTVQPAAHATEAVSASIGDVNDAAGEAGSAARHVLQSSSDLAVQADFLRDQVAEFLTTVRAA